MSPRGRSCEPRLCSHSASLLCSCEGFAQSAGHSTGVWVPLTLLEGQEWLKPLLGELNEALSSERMFPNIHGSRGKNPGLPFTSVDTVQWMHLPMYLWPTNLKGVLRWIISKCVLLLLVLRYRHIWQRQCNVINNERVSAVNKLEQAGCGGSRL